MGSPPNDQAQRTGHHDRPRNGKTHLWPGPLQRRVRPPRQAYRTTIDHRRARVAKAGRSADASPSTHAQDRISEGQSQTNSLSLRRIRRPNDQAQRIGHHDRPRNGKTHLWPGPLQRRLGRRAKHNAPPLTTAAPAPPREVGVRSCIHTFVAPFFTIRLTVA